MTLAPAPFITDQVAGAAMPLAPRVAEPPSRVVVWASRVAVAGLVGSMTLGAAGTGNAATFPLETRTATPQIKQDLYRLTQSPAVSATPRTADLVIRLHAQSGLTWDQVGRLLGVSRRAVHMWASGKRVNAHNAELLADLARMVDSAVGGTPDERRAWLFTATAGGATPVERFLSRHRQPGHPLSGSGYTPAELLGISTK